MKSPRRLRSHPNRAIHPSPTRRAAAARKVAMKSPKRLRSHPNRAIHPSLTRRAAATRRVAMKSPRKLKRNPIHPSLTRRTADTRSLRQPKRQAKEALQRVLRIPSPLPNLLWLSKHITLLTLLLNQATPPRTLNPLLTLQCQPTPPTPLTLHILLSRSQALLLSLRHPLSLRLPLSLRPPSTTPIPTTALMTIWAMMATSPFQTSATTTRTPRLSNPLPSQKLFRYSQHPGGMKRHPNQPLPQLTNPLKQQLSLLSLLSQ